MPRRNPYIAEKRPLLNEARIEELVALARDASARAYCPYSSFHVGAAVLMSSGEVQSGCNVENASYGLTICAERNAVFQAVAKGGKKIIALVIYTPTDRPAAPCGACRQVINEFGPDARIVSVCDGNERIDTTISRLLPAAFGPGNLKLT